MENTNERIKRCIVNSLNLDRVPSSIDDQTQLFAPSAVGGMELDSLAAIEIVLELSREFSVQLDEIPREAFETVHALGAYIDSKTQVS